MKSLIKFILLISLLATNAFADNISTLANVGMSPELATQVNAIYSTAINASEIPATDNIYDLGSASKQWRNAYIGTNVIFASGANIQRAVYAPNAAATPVLNTNLCATGLCVVPTTAANNAVYIGIKTPIVGSEFYIKNNNTANLIRAKVSGGATINGAVAGGYIGLAAGTSMHCIYYSATDLTCDTYTTAAGTTAVLPTPAGP